MAIMLARFKVADYDKWRSVFESKMDLRKQNGCNGTHIFYNAHDKTDVIINFQWDTEANAQAFFAGAEARAAMQAAGVEGAPEITFLEDGGRTAS
jgi:heme-degrading monooxygenase HmoA